MNKKIVREMKKVLHQSHSVDWDKFMSELNPSIEERFEAELNNIFDELEHGPHSDSKEYSQMIDALQKVVDARNAYMGNPSEHNRKKYEEEANRVNWNAIVPILLKGGFALAAVVFWVSVEQGKPTPMRLVNWTLNLLKV